jgi:hypothetical protein
VPPASMATASSASSATKARNHLTGRGGPSAPAFLLTAYLSIIMPTFNSVQYAAQLAAAANYADTIDDKRHIEGGIQYAFIDVAVAASTAQADIVNLIQLPVGSIVYPELSFIEVTDDMSSGAVTIDIGDTDVDRYCDGANCASVGRVQFTSAAIPDGYTNRHKITEATKLIRATFATLGATVEIGAFRVVLAYKSL